MKIKYTPEERQILDQWPVVTKEDIRQMNDLFPHYLFFRPDKTDISFWTSCCGRTERLEYLRRTELPRENSLLADLKHNGSSVCPWCGKAVTMKDLRKAGQRKSLWNIRFAVVLHAREDALYADAVALVKDYEAESNLIAPPVFHLSSMYRFAANDVMQIDHQDGWVTHERGRLGRRKFVQEPFKEGSVSWYHHEPYSLINPSALEECPVTRYSAYLSHWHRGDCCCWDLISYLTAYCIYPRQIEMLVKAGLREPLETLISTRKKNAKGIDWDEPDIRKAIGLTAPELREVIEKKPSMLALELRVLAGRWLKQKWTISEAVHFVNLWTENRARDVLRLCRQYNIAPQRLENYVTAQCVVDADMPWRDALDVFVEYRDYLDAVYHLGYCMEHSRVLWPANLTAAHDDATAQWAERYNSEVMTLPADSNLCKGKERAKKYCFELDGLRIVFPRTAAAIRHEGEVLAHCVGGYAPRHIKGVLTILFLRRASAPNTPYVTIEMDGNRIIQVHGYQNDRGTRSPRQVHKDFFDAWLAWLKAGSKRDKDGSPILPKKRRN